MVRNVGGRHKRKIRVIDFKRVRDDIKATVKSIEYDPNMSILNTENRLLLVSNSFNSYFDTSLYSLIW